MHCHYFVTVVVLLTSASANTQKITLETLNNYSEFLNFGVKKIKLPKNSLENSIIKSKVDVLGDIFKKNIETFKNTQKLELIFLIDGSSSVGETNFRSELKFVKKLLSDVTVDYNHTRVAIATFSSSVSKNIDQISDPRKENNKCFLLSKLLSKIEYTGGGTNTLKAFEVAKEIFTQSRNDSEKVLFLITDGFSNGGDPIPLAAELKKDQVKIFTIGIANGNYKELYELASTPGEIYSYLLDSFEEFESLARRALHVDLKSGEYIPLGINSPCANLCDDGDCCDKNALCTCGTTTGHYSCMCKLGYYGTGLKNSCSPCPVGQYSDGLNLCRPCPDMHHTTTPPAFSVENCTCKTGYVPTKDNRCKILKCPKMSTPEHGYFVKKRDCGNVLNSACGVRCEVGYSLVGSSIRLCQKNATWSGDKPSCQVKTCTKLPPPAYGSMICSHSDLGVTYNETEENLPVDTVCTFTCQDGKTLIGSSQRTCLPLARWDGLKTSCKQIKCPKLPPVKNGRVEPKSCTIGKQPYGKKCKISCNPGFVLEGPPEKTCTSNHGLWDSKFESTVCKDKEPPEITCPQNITASTQPGKNFATVSWNHPQVSDNAELEVSVWMKPSIRDVGSYKFQIGETQVTYFAQDAFHNRAKCSFYVIIKDEEPPVIDSCVSPPTYLTNEKGGANITWDEPNILDNSRNVQIKHSHDFGYFPLGTTTVTYTATDASGNRNFCSINITVEEAQCEALLDPIYGHSECSSLNDGMQCVITCQEGYAVPLSQPHETPDDNSTRFMCNNSDSVWYSQEDLMFPECSVTEIPNEIEQNGTVSVESDIDNCNNTEKINDLENDIKITLQETSCEENCTVNTDTTCVDDPEEEKTNIIKRETTDEVPHRRRGKKKRINVKFQVKGKNVNHTQETQNINLGSHNISIHYNKPKFFCPPGFVPRKGRCVQCPKGTFHNTTRNRCQSCPFDTFSDKLGQSLCTPCPKNHSTRKVHSKQIGDCKEQCPPGTHARKKIFRQSRRNPSVTIERATLRPYCRSCHVGFYQSEFGQLRCIPCPKGHTTLAPKATSFRQCVPTAAEMCAKNPSICNAGKCVPSNEFQYTCDCPEGYIGSHCERKTRICDSNPCFNNGICQEVKSNFVCLCPKGFTGQLCEENEEKCLLICLNNGTCHRDEPDDYFCWCPPGYGGETCEIKLNYCSTNICENNSTCVDELNGFKCHCSEGFIGKRCNILPCDYKPCQGNGICVNIMEANATKSSYNCVCPEGYTGKYCAQKIDYCQDSPCLNGGTCSSQTSSFECACPRFFYGKKCEFQRKSDYVLHFQKFSTTDYIRLNGFEQNLTQISACLWLQTKDNFNYGTLLSYATKNYDNAFTLTDYTGLVLYVNNQYAVTDVLLNDGLWHHLCVTWTSHKGLFGLYVDGKMIKSGPGLATGSEIAGGGNMVIGQEQDILGGHFSQSETFVGRMAYFDVWSKQLTVDEIQSHMTDCHEVAFGDVFGWPEAQNHVEGNVKIENSTFCAKCEDPKPVYNGIINIADNVAYYDCYEGFYLSHEAYKEGRKCTKAAKWEGIYEPYCKRVYCGNPGYVRNAYSIGTKYYFGESVTYRCYDGYNLMGNGTIKCTENGTWYPDKPTCVGLQCTAFKKPENSNLTIFADHSYEDFVENESTFDVGTQVEVICDPKSNISGENVITCQENGTWDFEPPKCLNSVTLSCDVAKVPTAPDNGYVILETLYEVGNGTGDTIFYKCRTGYKLLGDNSTSCIIDGYWTEPNITCRPVDCPTPKYHNMVVKTEPDQNGKYHFGNMVKFDCIDGYKIFGDGTIRCLANGRWSRMRAKCSKKSCRKPSVNEATIIVGNSYLFEDQVTLICPNKGQYVLTCDSTGTWIGDKDKTC
ncbi:sushi, von Willebrand factor type A, EGF and pentraxin domain-containing protein 1 isoform X1 [Tribolium castaneum]|uniref:sushi, von Willebrand factor type A, EGF and pentraxin domain-containing protein 1 isoform X1 n=1 Tax=Tribolium castaneum TaxID=7070 RepID=UPI00077DB67A|nr:PREDICTED: sushi, von Willebrand factor type A, EGF and pentraxin domain-containing protein 1 [Tribolium castaneum]|eukprot:XP_015834822.1 PREDICTED: sushi, von Willebrand factor type A, EGF and pentraxin domain-containing protein 1 [Tribolium castaneum]